MNSKNAIQKISASHYIKLMYYIFLSVKHVKITKKMHNLPILKKNIPFVQLMSIFEKLSVIMEIVAFNDIKKQERGESNERKELIQTDSKVRNGNTQQNAQSGSKFYNMRNIISA